MGQGSFEQLQGAAGDVKELEYISALHQTNPREVRRDGSIKAQDIALFLSSRYGIQITDEEVCSTILQGLGGGNDADECIDVMELTAILLIPTIIKAADQLAGCRIPTGVVKAPSGMLEYVLKTILHDVTGSTTPKALTADLLRHIFTAYGEHEVAADGALMDEMVQAAGVDSASSGGMLDTKAFATALTYDVRLYDLRNEVRVATNMDDIFQRHRAEGVTGCDNDASYMVTASERNDVLQGQDQRELLAYSQPLNRKFTAPAIDITAGTYRSKSLMVFLWATVLITYFAYWFDFNIVDTTDSCGEDFTYSFDSSWIVNSDALLCGTISSIVGWLIVFAWMSIFGTLLVGLGSIGNYVGCQQAWKPLMGATVVSLTVILPYTEQIDSGDRYLATVSVILGFITAFYHMSHVATLMMPDSFVDSHPRLRKWMTTSSIMAEMQIKRAAAHKLSVMTKNALEIVQINDRENVMNTHFGQALHAYAKHGKKFESVGGFSWCWKRYMSGEVFIKEGVWLSSRLIAANMAQYIVSFYTLLAGLTLTHTVIEDYDTESVKQTLRDMVDYMMDRAVDEETVVALSASVSTLVANFLATTTNSEDQNCTDSASNAASVVDALCQSVTGTGLYQCDEGADVNYLCKLIEAPDLNALKKMALLNASGFDVEYLLGAVRVTLQQGADESVDSLYPSEKYMVVLPMYVGTAVAFLTALYLAMSYIPSVTTTILRLRSGDIPTLRDPEFNRYRIAADQVSILTGSLFWGCFVSSVIVGGFVGLLVFVFVWQGTSYFVQRFVAIVVGIVVVTLIRQIVVRCCRCAFYEGFYRRKPFGANLSLLALEWANFALSAGFIFIRLIKLLLAAGASIGRIDTPFLAPGVGQIGRIALDNYPNVHLKDVLSQEAHRHPYIEQLGVIYLMKLRYRENFGETAGSCWRLLFVYSLMPWLHKYRVQVRPELVHSLERDSAPEGEKRERGMEASQLSFVNLRHAYDEDGGYRETTGVAAERITRIDAAVQPEEPVQIGVESTDEAAAPPKTTDTDDVEDDVPLGNFSMALDTSETSRKGSLKPQQIDILEQENESLRRKLAKLEAFHQDSATQEM